MSETSSNTTAVAGTRSARCPRCGYDQRGVIVTWKDSCPLEGVCSECGLCFEWAELLSTRVRWPRWCVEYATSGLTLPARAIKTLCRTPWPWGFWRSLQMHHAPRWQGMALYWLSLLTALYVLFAIGQSLIAARVWHALQQPSRLAGSGTPPKIISQPVGTVAVRALLLPFSRTSPAVVSFGGVKYEFPPPASFLPDVNGSTYVTSTGVWVRFQDYWYFNVAGSIPPSVYAPGRTWFARGLAGMATFLGHAGLTLAFSTLAFAALPQTRRRYKIRWSHVVRIAAYAAALLIVPAFIFVMHGQVNRILLRSASFDLRWLFLSCFVYWPIWLVAWWSAASRLYLRIPHAWGVGIGVVIVGMLCSLACGYLSFIARVMV